MKFKGRPFGYIKFKGIQFCTYDKRDKKSNLLSNSHSKLSLYASEPCHLDPITIDNLH